ncbi:MAG: DUF1080 domain-containing protein [Prosthecobacter sp.]
MCCISRSWAVEAGFEPLLDRDHRAGWKQCGKGGLQIDADGVGTTWQPKSGGAFGVNWFSERSFGDFVLRAEFSPVQAEYNSGIRMRFPDPGNEPGKISQTGYEISILHPGGDKGKADMQNGAIAHQQAPFKTASIRRPGEWNEIEVSAIGHRYSVSINGVEVNTFVGSRGLAGYIGIENHVSGAVRWRNIRIKDMSGTHGIPGQSPSAAPIAAIQTDANQPRIEVIKDQGPNAAEWALTPLDEAIPADIRQNLTFLREDLLDEGAKAAKSKPEAYKLASDYCDKLLTALDQRELARVNAGYRAAQADANRATSTQALNARRNYQMSWPQYAREESQRSALRESETDKADVKKERLKVEWVTRATQMRSYLDNLYRQLREAMR